MHPNRESNFDLLRILSAFAVVMLHVSGNFLQVNEIGVPTNCNFPVMILNHIVRFAVPCYLMLSGAFILSDERNADYKYLYKKSFENIGITSIIFCLLYVFYRIFKLMTGVFIFKKHDLDYILPSLVNIIKSSLTGSPFGHLWYLFTLMGLYLIAPFVIRLAQDLRGGVNLYGKATIVFIILGSVSYITSEHQLEWDIGWQFYFLSYFLMGYKLRQWGKTRKSNRTALILISAGIALNLVLAYINYLRGLKGLPVDVIQFYKNPFSYAPLAPIEVIASCLIFSGFSIIKIKSDFSNLSGYTFLIYLIHAGVIDVLFTILSDRLFCNRILEYIFVIIISVGVFLISLFGAILWKRIASFVVQIFNKGKYL